MKFRIGRLAQFAGKRKHFGVNILNGLFWFSALASLVPSSANAQDEPAPKIANVPSEKMLISPGGVDLRTGRYTYNETDLSIGSAGFGGLSLQRTLPNGPRGHFNPLGNFSHNWDIMIAIYEFVDVNSDGHNSGYRAVVFAGGVGSTFDATSTGGFAQKSFDGAATLTFSGSGKSASGTVYTYTAEDGTVTTFRALGKDCSGQICAFADTVISPDGTKFALSYASTGLSGSNTARLSSVTSSRGFRLILEGSSSINDGYGSLITKACVLNLATSSGDNGASCPAAALATAWYSFNGLRLISAEDGSGASQSFQYTSTDTGYKIGFVKPGQSAPWLTNYVHVDATASALIEQEVVDRQEFASGLVYSYNYGYAPVENMWSSLVGGGYSDNNGGGITTAYGFPIKPGTGPGETCTKLPCSPTTTDSIVYQQTSGPISVTDALGRVTMMDYCDPQAAAGLPAGYHNRCYVVQLQSTTDPAGIKTFYTYAGRNIVKTRQVPKDGSGLPEATAYAEYACSAAKCQSKPTSLTDPNGNVSTYSYDPAHGGVLVESSADVGGVKRIVKSDYVQRSAWVSNGAGAYTRGSSLIWLLNSQRTCQTSTMNVDNGTCAAGNGDLIVTAYDYGSDSGAVGNNLLLRGKGVTNNGVTQWTCFGYDALGNQISKTLPRSGLGACS